MHLKWCSRCEIFLFDGKVDSLVFVETFQSLRSFSESWINTTGNKFFSAKFKWTEHLSDWSQEIIVIWTLKWEAVLTSGGLQMNYTSDNKPFFLLFCLCRPASPLSSLAERPDRGTETSSSSSQTHICFICLDSDQLFSNCREVFAHVCRPVEDENIQGLIVNSCFQSNALYFYSLCFI